MTMCTYFGTLKLIIILWTSICLQDAQAIRNPFEVVQRCPFNESEWKVRAAHTMCNGSESYHCLLTEGGVSLREQCIDASLFTSGFCPIFTNDGYLQWSACKDTACPTSSYRSDEVYQYQICYQKTDNPIEKNTEKGSNDSSSVTGVTIIIVILLAFVAFVLVLVFVIYRRNVCGFRDKVQQCMFDLRTHVQNRYDIEGLEDVEIDEPPEQSQPLIPQEPVHAKPVICYEKDKTTKGIHDETCQRGKDDTKQKIKKLRELQKYLVHILKQELDVNDLSEKAVIHSKSINEHFSEPLRKDLQNVKDLNEYYNKLDMSLVFTLLRNFCEGITPPRRGWDYEPPDDETHVGADIERIRSMWNKYCDDDLQFKHIDDVYKRMKQKYGIVAVHGDDDVRNGPPKDEENREGLKLIKEKIQSIKLNPDCTVEKGIVITENITTALKILSSRNVVILKGVIGCGKTHALKAIQNHFQDKNLETAWVEPENILRKISESKETPTILLCDNLFGRFGSSVFSQNAVDQIEKVLKDIERSEQTTKVAIGIHAHVYDEVKKTLKLNFLHQKNITVEMDNLSLAESLLIFKEQLTKGHCKIDPNCWFKTVRFQSVLDKLSKNQGHIGGPFLSLMYCNRHEFFSDEAFSVNPIQTLVQHIQKMRDNSPKCYNCLIYLMCVQQHNLEDEPETWCGFISVEVTKNNLMDLAKATGLLHVENTVATLAHELLTTVLFKSLPGKKEVLLPVIQICDIDVFLQLSRPEDNTRDSTYGNLYLEYWHQTKEERKILKKCASRLARNDISDHPLMMIEFVKYKHSEYLNCEPKTLFPSKKKNIRN